MNRALPVLLVVLALAPRPAPAVAGEGAVSVRWDRGTGAVEAVGLDPTGLARLKGLGGDSPRWGAILSVRLARPPGQPEAAPIVGRHEVDGGILRFVPRYPFRPGGRYVARVDPRSLVADSKTGSVEVAFSPEPLPEGPPTRVVGVDPTGEAVPENLLKLYIRFSGPMSRGEAYRRVRVLGADGKPVARPFLEIGEELWNPEMTRLTLLFDPGRIKRGLVPREQEGPILEAGKHYTFEVDRDWPDASDRPLAEGFRRSYRAGPPDEVQPDPKTWAIDPPAPGSSNPLTVRFPEPMDGAMLLRAIAVRVDGKAVAGRVEVGEGERSWRFSPDRPWPAGLVELRVDSELEDLAGNSIARPFEVDVVHPPSPTGRFVTVPVRMRSLSR